MQIETYEVISVDEQQGDIVDELASEEAMALIESLGLAGQQELLAERAVGHDDSVTVRNPYREMTAEEAAIFGAILPEHTDVHRYSAGPIPLRVLQVAAHANELFDKVEVWHPALRSDPDPLLVGIKGEHRFDAKRFILARWGEILEPLDALRDKARTIVRAKAVREIAENKAKMAQFEISLDERIGAYLLGGPNETVWLTDLNLG